MASLEQQNRKLVKQIVEQLMRLGTNTGIHRLNGIQCVVNELGVIQVWDEQKREVISTKVAAEWLRLLYETCEIDNAGHSLERAWRCLDEARAKYGYGGTHTMNPGAGKAVQGG